MLDVVVVKHRELRIRINKTDNMSKTRSVRLKVGNNGRLTTHNGNAARVQKQAGRPAPDSPTTPTEEEAQTAGRKEALAAVRSGKLKHGPPSTPRS